jgi:hypothetical protein
VLEGFDCKYTCQRVWWGFRCSSPRPDLCFTAKYFKEETLFSCTDKERTVSVLAIGSKSASFMKRNHGERLEAAASDYSKNTITFALVCC